MIAIHIRLNPPINEAYVGVNVGEMETTRTLEDDTTCRVVTSHILHLNRLRAGHRSEHSMKSGNTHHSRSWRRQLADHFRRRLGELGSVVADRD